MSSSMIFVRNVSIVKHLICLLFSLLFVLSTQSHSAQNSLNGFPSKDFSLTLDKVERELKLKRFNEKTLPAATKRVSPIKEESLQCIDSEVQQIEQLKTDLASLGEISKSELADVKKKRRELKNDISTSEKQLASCRVFILRSETLLKELSDAQQKLLAARLLSQGPDIKMLLQENWNKPSLGFKSISSFLTNNSGLELLSLSSVALLLIVIGIAILLGITFRSKIQKRIANKLSVDTFTNNFTCSLLSAFAHYMPYLLMSLSAAAFFYIMTASISPLPFISVIIFGLPIYFILRVLIELFLDPSEPEKSFHAMPEQAASALSHRLKVFLLLSFVGYLLFATLLVLSLPEAVFLLAREIFSIVFVLNVVWAVWILGQIPRFEQLVMPRFGITVLLFSGLVIELLGYRNLTNYIVLALLGSLFLLGLFLFSLRLTNELFEGLEKGKRKWQRKVRESLGIKTRKKLPELIWTKLIIIVSLWLILGALLLRLWGLSEAGFEQLRVIALEGFTVGSLKIIPARILLAVIALTVLLAMSSWFRTQLERSWLSQTRIERGAREATATISGYIGVALALIISLSIAGVEFGNLAIIAGALSVGIGFGLQNIVNNFVSGLILLFERPIKTGDWIIVGQTEGFVRKISIRSTQIETFDQADVIVPNSELISGQVTNWMLKDVRGRIRVPVGVAYGSDTKQVHNILLDVGKQNSYVVTDGSSPEPKVLFMEFGDSALLFELRVFIQNIDQKPQIISDLNFAIDAAFRENNIEVPFPQRDIHIKGLPEQSIQNPLKGQGGKPHETQNTNDASNRS